MVYVQVTFILVLITISYCEHSQLVRLLDRNNLNVTECFTSEGDKGIYLLKKYCSTSNKTDRYVPSVGGVVCCFKEPKFEKKGDKAKSFCSNHGAFRPDLGFHIIGARVNAEPGELPHMAAIGYKDKRSGQIVFECGGSLISHKFVLTATHCCNSADDPPVLVRLGKASLDLTDRFDRHREHDSEVKRIEFAPGYISDRKYNDIALLELEDPLRFPFPQHIKPICLDTDDDNNFNSDESDDTNDFDDIDDIDDKEQRRNLTIMGYGMTNFETKRKASRLQKAYLLEVPLSECRQRYKGIAANIESLSDNIISSQLCGHDPSKVNRTDICRGDSGSPIMVVEELGRYRLVALVSTSSGCGSNLPSIFTRVSSYIGWIESIVWP